MANARLAVILAADMTRSLGIVHHWIGGMWRQCGAGQARAALGSYDGATGPAALAAARAFSACAGKGKEQSPVDLVSSERDRCCRRSSNSAYTTVSLEITNNGHAVVSNESGKGAKITIDGQPFELVQFHVHTPSEHEINGAPAELEIHFVHKNAKGDLAVVGLLAKKGAANPILAPFFSSLPDKTDTPPNTANGAAVDLAALIGNRKTYWAYEGSLTTPPCTEHVHWFVLDEPGRAIGRADRGGQDGRARRDRAPDSAAQHPPSRPYALGSGSLPPLKRPKCPLSCTPIRNAPSIVTPTCSKLCASNWPTRSNAYAMTRLKNPHTTFTRADE